VQNVDDNTMYSMTLSDEIVEIIRRGSKALPELFRDRYFSIIADTLHKSPPTPLTNGTIATLVRDTQRKFNPAVSA
jgi:hypothetical protein